MNKVLGLLGFLIVLAYLSGCISTSARSSPVLIEDIYDLNGDSAQGILDNVYLRLDTSNDPLTGQLSLQDALFTLASSKFINIDATRSGSETTNVIDLDIADTSSGNINYVDITDSHTAGNKTTLNISSSGTTGDSLPIYAYGETSGGGDVYALQTEATSTGGGNLYGFSNYVYDQAGHTPVTMQGMQLGIYKYLSGSDANGIQIISGGSEQGDTGIFMTGNWDKGIDLSTGKVTDGIVLAGNQPIRIQRDGVFWIQANDAGVDYNAVFITPNDLIDGQRQVDFSNNQSVRLPGTIRMPSGTTTFKMDSAAINNLTFDTGATTGGIIKFLMAGGSFEIIPTATQSMFLSSSALVFVAGAGGTVNFNSGDEQGFIFKSSYNKPNNSYFNRRGSSAPAQDTNFSNIILSADVSYSDPEDPGAIISAISEGGWSTTEYDNATRVQLKIQCEGSTDCLLNPVLDVNSSDFNITVPVWIDGNYMDKGPDGVWRTCGHPTGGGAVTCT